MTIAEQVGRKKRRQIRTLILGRNLVVDGRQAKRKWEALIRNGREERIG
jgi:hypothetical protein